MEKTPRAVVKKTAGQIQRGRFFIMTLVLGLMLVWVLNPGPLRAEVQGPGRPPLKDHPVVWYADDAHPIPVPGSAEPGLVPYSYQSFVTRPFSRFFHPGRFFRWVGDGDRAQVASNVNSLDEVVDSTWFTNRMGMFHLTDEELTAGPGLADGSAQGPDRSQPWTIIGAKTGGVTPGFRIRDGRGDVWLLKFDPPHNPGHSIRSGVVSNLLFYAIGFHVPVDRLVSFDRSDLVVGPGVTMKLERTYEVAMTEANLDSLLMATNSIFDGHYQALASRFLKGEVLGPFDDQGTRKDDPNDTIKHQNRRELRGLRMFAAWVNHFDTKMHNSLDMYIGQPGEGFVQHYLIDFASTLGTFGDKPIKRFGYEFGLDFFPFLGRTLALGLHEDPWVYLEKPAGLSGVGLFAADPFEPEKWKPDLPHSGMANMTRRDAYWAAKIISSFSDDQLRLIIEQGRYPGPASVDYLVQVLAARRDKIARYWFAQVPPLDYFLPCHQGLKFSDLAVERGFAEAGQRRYRYRLALVNDQRETDQWGDWVEIKNTLVPLLETPAHHEDRPFLAIEIQLGQGEGWSSSTTVYQGQKTKTIVALDR